MKWGAAQLYEKKSTLSVAVTVKKSVAVEVLVVVPVTVKLSVVFTTTSSYY
jgi:hypothetical protein